MSQAMFITNSELSALVAELASTGTLVFAPVVEGGEAKYQEVSSLDEVTLDGLEPRLSLKEFFLPATECLLCYRRIKDDVEIEEVPAEFSPRVVLGGKPCDVAALDIVDKVMDWDYHDELWFGRRKSTTVISLACPGGDKSCFCPAVGLGPDSTQGADILLTPAGDGFVAEIVTEKGQALVSNHSGKFSPAGDKEQAATQYKQNARQKVEANLHIDTKAIEKWMTDNFESDYWKTIALRCHGCGACAFVCPTCHCFDIVDEQEGLLKGVRRRNWDTCQTAKFTLHASGHNPRDNQNARIRQRVMHKFNIYPRRFEQILCTGCGRCVRACPASMDLLEILGQLNELSGEIKERE